jgi:hypothetical protein
MAEQKIVVRIGEHDVTSEIERREAGGGRTQVTVTSTLGERSQMNHMLVGGAAGYDAAQAEYDIENFRHRMAAELAAKERAHVVVGAVIAPVEEGAAVEVVSAPRFKKPEKKDRD